MNNNKLLYLSYHDVVSINVPVEQFIDALKIMYTEKGHGRVELPSKIGIHPQNDSFIHAMPAYIPQIHAVGMKWIGTFPKNVQNNLPSISGLIVLNDEKTGCPYCIMDARWVTAKRTGAKTALAATHFARSESSRVGIIACGVQGRSNLEALSFCFDIEQVIAYDINRDIANSFAVDMAEQLDLSIPVVENPEHAVRDMDIVVTSGPLTKHPEPVMEVNWIAPGTFVAPLDYDAYWKSEVFHQVDVFSTDDVNQLFFYQDQGWFQTIPSRNRVSDLGDVIAGKSPSRENNTQRIISMNLGLALDDVATAPLVYQSAIEKELGTWLEL